MAKHFYLRDNQRIQNNSLLSSGSKELFTLEKSHSTIDAYESDWSDFCDWCNYRGIHFFPATPETIVNYIHDLSAYAKANTIARRVSALSENFTAGGLIKDNPCLSPLVKAAMKGIRRKIGTYQQGKSPLLKEDLEAIVQMMDVKDLTQHLDKTVLVIGFMGAFRRSELSSIRCEDVHFVRQGIEIFIPRSKADQEGEGNIVALPNLTQKELCPVTTLKSWLSRTKITSGPVFRSPTKTGKLRKNALSDQMVNRIVKRWVEKISLDPADYGAHSLRHGFATSAALAGIEERRIMQQTRHHSVEMVRHYINEADRFEHNPLRDMFSSK